MGFQFPAPAFRSLLSLPIGAHGYDPNHIAAAGSLIRGSWVATGGGCFLNLLNGTRTTHGSLGIPTTTIAPVGLAVDAGNVSYGVNFATWPNTESPVAFTGGFIFTITRTPAAAGRLFTTNGVNTSGGRTDFNLNSSLATSFTLQGVGFPTNWPALVVGHSYFIAWSCIVPRQYAVCLDLTTGQLLTFSRIGNVTISSTQATWGIGGGPELSTASASGCAIAACMYSQKPMSLQHLLQWAQNPWGFWYPQNPSPFVGTAGLIVSAGALLGMLAGARANAAALELAASRVAARAGGTGTARETVRASTTLGVRPGVSGTAVKTNRTNAAIGMTASLTGAARQIERAATMIAVMSGASGRAGGIRLAAGAIRVAAGITGAAARSTLAAAALACALGLMGISSTRPVMSLIGQPRMVGRKAEAELRGEKSDPDIEGEVGE